MLCHWRARLGGKSSIFRKICGLQTNPLASRIAVVSVASNPDILIIGAGLAGAAAAEELSARGFIATVLEARDRVGGRGFSRPFATGDELLDFGGAWIRPWQVHIHDACARHGVALRPRAPATERRWFRDGALHKDGPASPEDLVQHERCVARIAADALALKKGEERNELGQLLNGHQLHGLFDAHRRTPGDTRSVRRLVDGQRHGDPRGFPQRNSCRAAPVAAARPTE